MIRTAAYTLWTAPSNGRLPGTPALWSLSVLCALQHFGSVELFTDELGEDLLCRQLRLPFTRVWRTHDAGMIGAPANVWSLGKMYTYRKLAERGSPFVHIDGDAVLLNPLPERLLGSGLLAEMPETWEVPNMRLSWMNPIWQLAWRSGDRKMWNCGIFGGRSLDAIYYWSKNVLLQAAYRSSDLGRMDGTAASILLEQWSMRRYFLDDEVTTLFRHAFVSGDEAQAAGYAHFKGPGKLDPVIQIRVKRELRKRFPGQADLVAKLEAL